jgi:hypothetical protein
MTAPPARTEPTHGYRTQAIVLAAVAEVLLVAAVASWLWVDSMLAVVLLAFALVLGLSAANSSKAARLSRQLERYIDHRESVQSQLGAMLAGGTRGRRKPVLVVLTELHLYVFELHIAPRPAEIRTAYANLLSIKLGAPKRPSTLLIELQDRTLELHGMQVAELRDFEDVLAVARPGLGTLAEELREAQAD